MIQIFCTPYVKPVKIDEAQAADPHKRIAIGLAVNQQRLFLAGKTFFIFTPGDAVRAFVRSSSAYSREKGMEEASFSGRDRRRSSKILQYPVNEGWLRYFPCGEHIASDKAHNSLHIFFQSKDTAF